MSLQCGQWQLPSEMEIVPGEKAHEGMVALTYTSEEPIFIAIYSKITFLYYLTKTAEFPTRERGDG